jgi:hypothetical protein
MRMPIPQRRLAARIALRATAVLALVAPGGCDARAGSDDVVLEELEPEDFGGRSREILETALLAITARADSVDDALQPMPLLTPGQESALRQYGNAEQLARARALGVRPADSAATVRAIADGTLVELEDSTAYWVVRELDHSVPFVTPGTRALLQEIGERFQERIGALDLPPYRLEVTSVLRTAESQADLRTTNPNAAAGTSTHEYGTTLDLAYSSYAAPADAYPVDHEGPPWLGVYLDRIAAAVLEAAAARKSRELQAILGEELRRLQDAGAVMVTLERQQPVYHITVAR